MTRINNEAKVRRSTMSVVLGKSKVMGYEDIEETRAKRVRLNKLPQARENVVGSARVLQKRQVRKRQ